MLGIIGAMEIETRQLVAGLTGCSERTVSGIPFFTGLLRGTHVVVGRCGAGKVNATICAQLMISVFGADAIINTGVAGGLAPAMRQYDIVVADAFVQHDIDTTAVGDPIGMISGINMVELPVSGSLSAVVRECAESVGCTVHTGTIATGDQFVSDPVRASFIADTFRACACDMEGGAIAQVCFMSGTAFAALRCISDNADGSAGASYAVFAPNAADLCSRLVYDIAERTGYAQ